MFKLIIKLISILSFVNCYSIDLEEIICKAIKNSSKLKSQFYQYKSTKNRLKSIYIYDFFPNIDLQYKFINKNFSFEKNISEIFDIEIKLTINQKIINSNSFTIFNVSNYLINIEKIKFQQLKQEIALDAVKAYVDVLRMEEILKLRKHKELVSLENLSTTKKRLSIGESINTEVSLAKAKFLSSVSERINAEAKLKLAKISYFNLIGEYPNNLLVLEIQNLSNSIPELNECLRLAKINNLSLKLAIFQKKIDKINVLEKTFKWISPSLNFAAIMNIKPGVITQSYHKNEEFLFDKILKNSSIIFTFNIPLFKSGINIFDINNAKMNVKKSTHNFYELKKNIEKDVITAWNNVLTANSIINAMQELEKAASLAVDGVKQEVNLNLKTTTELLNTEDTLFKARFDLVDAKSNYIINAYNLLFMIGNYKFLNLLEK